MNNRQAPSGERSIRWIDRLGRALSGPPADLPALVEVLRDAHQRELIDADALVMIEGVLEVSEMQVRDIMVSRSQMIVVERNWDLETILPVIAESAHSRFPVIGESRNEVLGLLLAKDLLPYFQNGKAAEFSVRDVLRRAVFIPESKRLNVLLKDFRSSRNHMAIVVDEYGGVSGLVTIEDVLEQIVGDISDEHDIDEDGNIMRHSERHFTVKALTPIEDFNEYFGSDFSDEEFDTVGGLIMREFGHLPKRGEVINIEGFHFKVLHSDSRRIHLLQLTIHRDETTASSDDSAADRSE